MLRFLIIYGIFLVPVKSDAAAVDDAQV